MQGIDTLSPNAKLLVKSATEWLDPFWDPATGLLWAPALEQGLKNPLRHHLVRDTAWYVVGLLLRRSGSDVFRGLQSILAILEHQFNNPGQPYHGTFRRSPEEQDPGEQAVEWRDYDPNWREFICTVFDLILIEFSPLIPDHIEKKIAASYRLAVEGALARGLRPNYTNIALMHAYLLCQAGLRLNDPGWVEKGEDFAREIYSLFNEHGAFEEYNSPTYYGVDLFALALWRKYKPTPLLGKLGTEMEDRLWRDISRYYHPVLRNMCGPYDRAYDMDMRKAIGVLGEWIYLITGPEKAPFPDVNAYFGHTPDICFSPCAAILGAAVPEDVRENFLSFLSERSFSQVITTSPRREATAWLSEKVMVGAEDTSFSKKGGAQFHPATIHWQLPDGDTGWIRVRNVAPVNAKVENKKLSVESIGTLEIEYFCGHLVPVDISAEKWVFPGLTIHIAIHSSAEPFSPNMNKNNRSIIYNQNRNISYTYLFSFL